MMANQKGFTMIELIFVIIILGILAAVAIPRFLDMQEEAKLSAERGVVGGVRAGIATEYADACRTGTCAWPTALSSSPPATNGSCTEANACFDNVLQQGGVTEDWVYRGSNNYQGPWQTDHLTGACYEYNNADGSFLNTTCP